MLTSYQRVRQFSDRLAETLTPEDATLQSMPDASPAKWHLAHTTWFFETFLLSRFDPQASGFAGADPAFAVLFNSYYNSVGEQFPRPRRGLLSRPTLDQVRGYRASVDDAVARLAEDGALVSDQAALEVLSIGLNHEQQHQELLVTDIKHALAQNPIDPAYRPEPPMPAGEATAIEWRAIQGGVHPIGHDGNGFAYDNEGPRHSTLVQDFEIATRPVTCGEFLRFIDDSGYSTPTLWLAEGWNSVNAHHWRAPLYWRQEPDGSWTEFTTAGRIPLNPARPVTHISYFEADAYARWARCRLPTEFEWEVACNTAGERGAFADQLLDGGAALHPTAAVEFGDGLSQMLGDVWEWTSSSYSPYPGYRAADGALGEYNGKFMVNQQVLRGGSCATSSDHIRPTYRNFFATAARWQFSGVRLARDAASR